MSVHRVAERFVPTGDREMKLPAEVSPELVALTKASARAEAFDELLSLLVQKRLLETDIARIQRSKSKDRDQKHMLLVGQLMGIMSVIEQLMRRHGADMG